MPVAVTEAMGSPRILAGTRAELRLRVVQDGDPVDITSPAVVLTNADTGAAITPAAAVVEEPTGKLVQVLTGVETSTVQRIKAAWSVTAGGQPMTFTTYHEVVGDLLFTVPEARAFDPTAAGVGTLADEERYTQAGILEARDQIWEAFEDICGVGFGLRATREVLDGLGTATVWLGHMECYGVTAAATRERGGTTWTALTVAELADVFLWPDGRLYRESLGVWPAGARNVRVDYTHGHMRVPLEIKRAALQVLRDQLPGSNIGLRALSETNELGTFRLAVPGERGRWFGIPPVDEVLSRYNKRMPGLA